MILNVRKKICDNIYDWVEKNPTKGHILNNLKRGYYPNFSKPQDLDGNVISFHPDQVQIKTYDRYLACLYEVKLHTNEGFLQLSDDSFVIETAWVKSNLVENPVFKKFFSSRPVYKKGSWFSCLLFWSYGYYHWMCDVLPRFHTILELLPDDVQFIVPETMEDWKYRSLELLGIDKTRIVNYQGQKPWKLEKLYYAPPISMTGDSEPEALSWVRNKLLIKSGINISSHSNYRRIYLSRAKARCRRIVNEDEFFEFIHYHGFERIFTEDYTFDEQISIFSNAEFVIAPHGAGLSNILFSNPSLSLLELFEKSSLRRCYWSLSNALNQDYSCYLGNSVVDKVSENNIEINMPDFEGKFLKWLQNRALNK